MGIARTLAVGLFAGMAVGAASAGTATLSSDAQFITLQTNGDFTKQFGGNVRWGNGTAVGDWEYAIVDGTDAPIGAVAQAAWSGINIHDVVFNFDAGAASATLTLVGIGSITRSVSAVPSVLWARVQDGATPFSSLSNIQVDLAYNGAGVDYSFASLVGDVDAQYWGLSDDNLKFGFTLTADADLSGPRQGGSSPMYQFKVGVPTPGAAALMGLGVLVAGRRRR